MGGCWIQGFFFFLLMRREFCTGLIFLFLSVNLVPSVFLALRHDISLGFKYAFEYAGHIR